MSYSFNNETIQYSSAAIREMIAETLELSTDLLEDGSSLKSLWFDQGILYLSGDSLEKFKEYFAWGVFAGQKRTAKHPVWWTMTVSCAIHPTEHRLLKKGEKLEDYLSPIYLNVSSRKYTPESPGASQLFMTEYVDEFMTKIDKSMGNNFNKKIPCILDEDKQHTNLPCCILLEITSLTYGEETGHWYGKMSTLGFQNVGLRDRINREHDYEQQQRTNLYL